MTKSEALTTWHATCYCNPRATFTHPLGTLGTLLAIAHRMPPSRTLTHPHHFKGSDGAVRVVEGGALLPSMGCHGALMRREGGGRAVLSAVPSCDLSFFCLHR